MKPKPPFLFWAVLAALFFVLVSSNNGLAQAAQTEAAPPTLLHPADNITVSQPRLTFKWTPVAGATKYQLKITNTTTGKIYFYTVLAGACDSQVCAYRPLQDIRIHPHVWKVRAYVNGAWQAGSSEFRFRASTRIPQLSPGFAATVDMAHPWLVWTYRVWPASYEIMVKNVSGQIVAQKFVSKTTCDVGAGTCTWQVSPALPAGTYTWYVRGRSAVYGIGAWNVRSFTITVLWYSVHFTYPQSSAQPDADLAAAIDQAQYSVDIAAYDFDLWSLRDALIDAHQRGVQVRMVIEKDNSSVDENPVVAELINAGIPVITDLYTYLMHNKFVIIDGVEVWTGSMNFTYNGAYNNDNNLIQIISDPIAENYSTEFEEMFTSQYFGPTSPANTPNPVVTIAGVQVETYFSPDDGVQEHIIQLIEQAEESIYFLAYVLTADNIRDALIAANDRSVDVIGVIENQMLNINGSDYQALLDAGITVLADTNPDIMHHKVFVIDGQIVITGSYNFSASAEESNDENLLIIYHAPIAALYLDEFLRIYQAAQ